MAEFSENRHISNLINMSCKVLFILHAVKNRKKNSVKMLLMTM